MPAENTSNLPDGLQAIVGFLTGIGALGGGKAGLNWWRSKNGNGASKSTRKAVEELERKLEPIMQNIATQLESISRHMESQTRFQSGQSQVDTERDKSLHEVLRTLNQTTVRTNEVLAELKGILRR